MYTLLNDHTIKGYNGVFTLYGFPFSFLLLTEIKSTEIFLHLSNYYVLLFNSGETACIHFYLSIVYTHASLFKYTELVYSFRLCLVLLFGRIYLFIIWIFNRTNTSRRRLPAFDGEGRPNEYRSIRIFLTIANDATQLKDKKHVRKGT